MKIHIITLAITLLTISSTSFAQTECPQFSPGGQSPIIINPKLAPKYKELCNAEYSVGHSGLTRTPLWAAGHLQASRMKDKGRLARSNKFTPDTRIPFSERSELADYARSGYDRGHVFAAADATTQEGQDSTFLLSNMTPMTPLVNRGIWEGIETATRNEAKKRGELYVITGPIFQGGNLQSLRGRVIIPTSTYKCLYDPHRNESGCYIQESDPNVDYRVATVLTVEQLVGMNLFPSIDNNIKNTLMRLPAPKVRKR